MKQKTQISRRTFLKTAGALSALFLVPKVLTPDALKRSADESLFGGHLKLLFKNRASAEAVGKKYLEFYPDEASAKKIVGALEAEHGWQKIALASSGKRKFNLLVKKAVSEDFRAGKTVRVEGWMLARTEARLCALASLGYV